MEKFEENVNDKTVAGVEICLNSQGGSSVGDKLQDTGQSSIWKPCEVDWESAVHIVKDYEIQEGHTRGSQLAGGLANMRMIVNTMGKIFW